MEYNVQIKLTGVGLKGRVTCQKIQNFFFVKHSLDYTDNFLDFLIKFSRRYRLYNFHKIAINLNTSCCGRMWTWSHVWSQESFLNWVA